MQDNNVIDHLRVSTNVPKDENVEIAHVVGDQSDGDNESEADFYQPVGLSPMKTRNNLGSA